MAETTAMMDDTEDVALNFGEEDSPTRQRKLKHPIAVIFHLVFRLAAILAYLLCGWFSSSFIANFVVIVLLLSMDFWTVKNISGRLLVGLRWWNHVDEDGKSHWIFESRKGAAAKTKVHVAEVRIFWLSLVICEVIWIVFFFGTIFTLNFKWFMVVLVGILLNGANLYGYIRCKLGGKKQLSSAASNFLGQQVFRSMLASIGKQKETPATAPTMPT
ncbi:Golgi apparatus membrane protein TVP23 homolog B-like [Tubulanus polymorphus]|uniref:Golgi apparatus membrane protein TVP23 homolog B-like n=1 Tax=Tubulanus polymorphus TaxID=672921 RepID=UPI003DA2B828